MQLNKFDHSKFQPCTNLQKIKNELKRIIMTECIHKIVIKGFNPNKFAYIKGTLIMNEQMFLSYLGNDFLKKYKYIKIERKVN